MDIRNEDGLGSVGRTDRNYGKLKTASSRMVQIDRMRGRLFGCEGSFTSPTGSAKGAGAR